jgi:anti-sigma factor RsiW
MSTASNIHDERREDIAAYTLGALDEGAVAELEAHLAECEVCTEYLAWLQPAVDLLPASVAQAEPPTRLQRNLMKTVRAEAGQAQAERSAPGERSRWSWRGLVLRPATGFAALAVLVAGAITGYALRDTGPERSFAEARVAASISPDEVSATVEHGAGGDAILHVSRIPELDDGHVYQAWVQRDGRMEPAAAFRPDADGSYEAALGDSLAGAEAVAVTEEPGEGETRPSQKLVLTAPLR